ncbi:MAG: acyclic terpene utilization AtuA family protein [Desulfobacterales bacterium]
MSHPKADEKLIIANCSGFFGDRLSAARQMVEGGPVHVLTGDYLAELTMAILLKDTLKDPDRGYARTFLNQMEEIMGQCLEKGIKVVSNAGGLNPAALAQKLCQTADQLGLHPKIACITGDNLMGRLEDLQSQGEAFIHMDKNISLKQAGAVPITANAYFGGWGIAKALEQGADIVVCGRVADAALAAGPAAWHFKWNKTDWDRLAGAYAAGHVIECGAQATGGNYSFIDEVLSYRNVGFPIAEIFKDGSFVITKHPNTGGLVSTGTVTAQLLYEIASPAYLTPDVTVHFDTLMLEDQGNDRVLASGVRGGPPPETAKMCINTLGGYKNSMTVVLTGLDIEKKARIVEDTLFDSIGGKQQFQTVDVQLIRSDKTDPPSNDEAFAFLRITVMDRDAKRAGRFSNKVVELALANIPGFTATSPPGKAAQTVVHWPSLVSMDRLTQIVEIGDKKLEVKCAAPHSEPVDVNPEKVDLPEVPQGPMVKAPLGKVFAARSGDKGGNANLGVWAKTPEAYAFLRDFLTPEKLKDLLPDCAPYETERFELSNLLAVNFYIHGILGDGVAASTRSDPQAKTLGEYLRAKVIEMPASIVPEA